MVEYGYRPKIDVEPFGRWLSHYADLRLHRRVACEEKFFTIMVS